MYDLADDAPAAPPVPQLARREASPEPEPSGPARRQRSREREFTEEDDRLTTRWFTATGLIVGGFVIWLLPSYGILLRSRGDRIAGRPGDPTTQRFAGQAMMAIGILMVAWYLGSVILTYLREGEGPHGGVWGWLMWGLAGLTAVAGIGFLIVNNLVTGLAP